MTITNIVVHSMNHGEGGVWYTSNLVIQNKTEAQRTDLKTKTQLYMDARVLNCESKSSMASRVSRK